MDKGTGAANDTQAPSSDDLTAALELDFIASKFVNNNNFDITTFNPHHDELNYDIQNPEPGNIFRNFDIESFHQDAFDLGVAGVGNSDQEVSMSFGDRQPMNGGFDEPDVLMFSEVLRDGEPISHLINQGQNFTTQTSQQTSQHSDPTTPAKIGTRFSSNQYTETNAVQSTAKATAVSSYHVSEGITN
ncbi:uncharacterized protein ColSpa_11215 [Colletotrichum spaethianum]|uniref:Uncharacterized protein n=1 Tax=Colletotrichum spaethianum TaxID=700344 RepID=A0AA37PF30_9PEZI|nr:uncharacterized protein ColSpa_11215 [Colletotrichum spaethianum]GKT51034.1 hypothetical protein ColSpa_11215 [Colletotrichum spaethianum]